MMELIIVRHGETDCNLKGTYYGWSDVDLNENGIRQACHARDKLKGLKADAIFSSPLKRALETAKIINENCNLEIICSDSLKERGFGKWEDLTRAEIENMYPDEYKLWTEDWMDYCIEGGESARQAYSRVTGFMDALVSSHKEGVFIIVSHLGCIRIMIAHLLNMPAGGEWRFRVDNGSITKIEINDEKYAYLTALNF